MRLKVLLLLCFSAALLGNGCFGWGFMDLVFDAPTAEVEVDFDAPGPGDNGAESEGRGGEGPGENLDGGDGSDPGYNPATLQYGDLTPGGAF